MKTQIWFVILAVLMLIPCYFGLLGIHGYYTSSDPLFKSESLIVIGFMAVYSLVLVIPYLISYFLFKQKLSQKFKLYTFLPFILMLLITIYGTFLGIPW
ncbi:hypothetical protein OO007_12885 [Cocleimonas sp. KMM 6892]|uniref:hypothetical protein n=1 Tax=unclassified Cocleimonas TaxID=2639732 RepID=UPI002DBFC5FF|nr:MULTISPECIES: hypothetical protein [unclassified Cocleimonas]MEB8433126.1 hypothetical protein [Cocleimonas sp. KMM 6892]MEC4715893.1 hypothetical protein [Cocleimonas sp. KMM 6895]MEC4745354.1 hypothetical protein [Cocleimonas sp. KMM 6896]